jgi:hypothetical protein
MCSVRNWDLFLHTFGVSSLISRNETNPENIEGAVLRHNKLQDIEKSK